MIIANSMWLCKLHTQQLSEQCLGTKLGIVSLKGDVIGSSVLISIGMYVFCSSKWTQKRSDKFFPWISCWESGFSPESGIISQELAWELLMQLRHWKTGPHCSKEKNRPLKALLIMTCVEVLRLIMATWVSSY